MYASTHAAVSGLFDLLPIQANQSDAMVKLILPQEQNVFCCLQATFIPYSKQSFDEYCLAIKNTNW